MSEAAYNLDARIELSDKDLAALYTRVDAKLIRKAILRSADVAVGMAITKIRDYVDADAAGAPSPEFQAFKRRRSKGMLKEYRRWATRLRGRFDGDTVRSQTTTRFGAALALEVGGTYEQWVHSYKRKTVRRDDKKGTQKTTIGMVKEHKSRRTERERDFMGRAFTEIGPVAMTPLDRAIESVFANAKVPTQAQLRKGLL